MRIAVWVAPAATTARAASPIRGQNEAEDEQMLPRRQTDHPRLSFFEEAAIGTRGVVVAMLEAEDRLELANGCSVLDCRGERSDGLLEGRPPPPAVPGPFRTDRHAP